MSTHTIAPKISKVSVIQIGSRRRWRDEEKLRIIAEAESMPANVAATARRYGLSSGQLSDWRKAARAGKLVAQDLEPGFVRVLVGPGGSPGLQSPPPALAPVEPPANIATQPEGRMEIVLWGGARRLVVGRDVDVAVLARVLTVLERR